MAGTIDLTGGGSEPIFGNVTGSDTATLVKARPYSTVTLQAQAAIHVYNGLGAGGTTPANRFEFSATLAQSGVSFKLGGPAPGGSFATINVALQSGSGTLYASAEPPANRGS